MPTAKTKSVEIRSHAPNDFGAMNRMIEVASL